MSLAAIPRDSTRFVAQRSAGGCNTERSGTRQRSLAKELQVTPMVMAQTNRGDDVFPHGGRLSAIPTSAYARVHDSNFS
jgi:hypothetical protein